MAKNRRTKKQKIAAAARHTPLVITTSGGQTHISVAPIHENTTASTAVRTTPTMSHAYVVQDIRRTLSITTALVALDVVAYFLLKLRFVNILVSDFNSINRKGGELTLWQACIV